MKKKLLFVIPEYSIGGTNTSLKNLLSFIDKNKYEISIYSLYEDGTDFFKNEFHPYIVKKSLLYHLAHDNKLTRKVMGLLMKLSQKVNFNWLYRYEANRIQRESEFDSVIAFQECSATYFVSMMKDCKNRIAWIHCDYKNRGIFSEYSIYSRFDHIISVSQSAVKSVCESYPDLANRVSCIYNAIDTEKIIQMAFEASNPYKERANCFRILSVGRFVEVKQFHRIPQIVEDIKKLTGKYFCWYIIGDGADRSTVEQEVRRKGLSDSIHFLGAKNNPYPYFYNADLHVCTSLSESFSYTIAESKVLHTPVLTNDFPVAREVVDSCSGWICNIDEMPQLLSRIINDEDGIYSRVKKSISTYVYDNQAILDEFYKMISV